MDMPYFKFKGIDSSDYLVVNKLPPIIRAEKDIEIIPVPGRDGFLTTDLGSYKGTIKSVECTISDLTNIDYICAWLVGSGEAIFSNEPTKRYKATIKNQIDFGKILQDYRNFIIQFECQPHKYYETNDLITKTSSPATVVNPGTVNSKPVIKVTGSGTITLTINSKTITLANVSGYVTIDSDLVSSYKDAAPKNNDMTGLFPELIPGTNNISWTGTVSKIEITPNWRYV